MDDTGNHLNLPIIVTAEEGVLLSHLKYLVFHEFRSLSWKKKSVQAVRMLIDYQHTNRGLFENPQIMFERFVSAVFSGTKDEHGTDPSGLHWHPKSIKNGNILISHITKFSEFLYRESDGKTEILNKIRESTGYEKIMLQASYQHRFEQSFLKHVLRSKLKKENLSLIRNINPRKEHNYNQNSVKSFPEEYIGKLLNDGFSIPGVLLTEPVHLRVNLRNVLITMLMHYGGIRLSEAFHIYVNDIYMDIEKTSESFKEIPTINIYHPSDGRPPDTCYKTRMSYLRGEFGLNDRLNDTRKSYHSGWKNPAIDRINKAMRVYFFPCAVEKLWFELWRLYVKYQRIPPNKNRHPFAFTNKNGDPAGIHTFQAAHKNAVQKIGLTPSKYHGTTPHGHRHAYGKRLANEKIDHKIIAKVLHHNSLESQKIYTEPDQVEIRKSLNESNINLPSTLINLY